MGFYSTTVIAVTQTWCATCGSLLEPIGARPTPPDFLVQAACRACHKQFTFAALRISARVDAEAAADPRQPELLDIGADAAQTQPHP